MDQRISEYESWDELREYCRHSADPVGRLVLGVLGRAGRRAARRVVGRRVHRPPARELPPGRAARPGSGTRVPAGRGSPPLRRHRPRRAERAADASCSSSRPIGRAACSPRASGCAKRSAGAPARRSGSSRAAAWPRSTPCATRAGTSSTGGRAPRARASHAPPSPRSCDDDGRGGLRRRRAADAGAGAKLRLRDHAAAEVEAAGDRRDLRVRARGGRRRGRSRARQCGEAGAAGGSCGRAWTAAMRTRRCSSRSPTRGAAIRSRARRSTTSSTAASRTRSRRGTRRSTSSPRTAGAWQGPSASRASPSTVPTSEARRDARRRAPADQHHSRRGRGLGRWGVCTCRRTSWPDSACPRRTSAPVAAPAEWRALMAHQAQRAREHLAEGRTLLPRLDRRSAACVAAFAEPLRGDARPDRGARLRRVRRAAAAVAADEAPASCGAGVHRRERRRHRRRPGRARGRARARRPGSRRRRSTRRGRRSAAPCRRSPSARAIPRRRPTTASTSRSAASREYLRFLERIGEGAARTAACRSTCR